MEGWHLGYNVYTFGMESGALPHKLLVMQNVSYSIARRGLGRFGGTAWSQRLLYNSLQYKLIVKHL